MMWVAAALFWPLIQAEPVAAEGEASGWSGALEVSVSSSSGNTDNTVVGARGKVQYEKGRYKNVLSGGWNLTRVRTTKDGVEEKRTTQDRRFVEYRLDVHTGDRTFLYGRTRFDQDEFSGFDNRLFLGAGIGHGFAKNDAVKWEVLAGPGVQYTDVEDVELAARRSISDGTSLGLFLGSDFEWHPLENLELGKDLAVTLAEDNTTVDSRVFIKTKVTETIASQISYEVDYESNPPVGRETTDRLLRASVVYSF